MLSKEDQGYIKVLRTEKDTVLNFAKLAEFHKKLFSCFCESPAIQD